MTALIVRLECNALVLRRHYLAARDAFAAHPTPARMDERMAALKAFFVKVRGADWAEKLAEVMERERRECVAAMNAANQFSGQSRF